MFKKKEVKEVVKKEAVIETVANDNLCAHCKREFIRFTAFNDGLKFCSTEHYNAFYGVK